MIRYKNGQGEIEGNLEEILTEFTAIIKHVHEILEKHLGEKAANELIATAGRVAFMPEEDLEKSQKELERMEAAGDRDGIKEKVRAFIYGEDSDGTHA